MGRRPVPSGSLRFPPGGCRPTYTHAAAGALWRARNLTNSQSTADLRSAIRSLCLPRPPCCASTLLARPTARKKKSVPLSRCALPARVPARPAPTFRLRFPSSGSFPGARLSQPPAGIHSIQTHIDWWSCRRLGGVLCCRPAGRCGLLCSYSAASRPSSVLRPRATILHKLCCPLVPALLGFPDRDTDLFSLSPARVWSLTFPVSLPWPQSVSVRIIPPSHIHIHRYAFLRPSVRAVSRIFTR